MESLIVALGLFFNGLMVLCYAFELHQTRKIAVIQVVQNFQNRYDALLEDAGEFSHVLKDPNFDFAKLKTDQNLSDKVAHWTERYFWLCFDQWIEGHVRKSIPRYLKKDWDYIIQATMREPFFRQMWERVFRNKNFRGYKNFNEFMDEGAV